MKYVYPFFPFLPPHHPAPLPPRIRFAAGGGGESVGCLGRGSSFILKAEGGIGGYTPLFPFLPHHQPPIPPAYALQRGEGGKAWGAWDGGPLHP
jgi:hypothetical protein